MEMDWEVFKLSQDQIKKILDRLVPLIAEPKDHEFFRGLIGIKLEECHNSAEVAVFVQKILNFQTENRSQ